MGRTCRRFRHLAGSFRGRHIGIVLQQFHLLPTLTAMQNLLVAQSIAGYRSTERCTRHANALGVDERVDACLHQSPSASNSGSRSPEQLGEFVGILLVAAPQCLPDGDQFDQDLYLLLGATRRHSVSLVIATHDTRLKSKIPRHLALPRRPT
jgi:putative ABC transport system ATP-binding protein